MELLKTKKSRKAILIYFLVLLFGCSTLSAQQVAKLHYNGGGDWYSNPTSLVNLVRFCNENIDTSISEDISEVKPNASAIFDYPYLYATGHGSIIFEDKEIDNLQKYLLGGGFLHIDDNYGMKPYALKALKQLFPEKELIPIGSDHKIFHSYYNFEKGLPKIHEHDNKPPEALGIFDGDRLIVLLTLECDLGDGWEDQIVHNNPESLRRKALEMGANIIHYIFTN